MATYKQIAEWILAPFGHSLSGGQAGVDYMLRNRVLRVRQDIVDNAAADTYTRYVLKADKALTITAITIIPDAVVTAHNTNYATMSFATGTAGSMTSRDSILTTITGTDDWAAGVPEAFTVVPDTDSLAVGELLSYSKAVAAAGVAIPGHTLEVHYEYA